jgi:hypothetical protein
VLLSTPFVKKFFVTLLHSPPAESCARRGFWSAEHPRTGSSGSWPRSARFCAHCSPAPSHRDARYRRGRNRPHEMTVCSSRPVEDATATFAFDLAGNPKGRSGCVEFRLMQARQSRSRGPQAPALRFSKAESTTFDPVMWTILLDQTCLQQIAISPSTRTQPSPKIRVGASRLSTDHVCRLKELAN